MPEFGEVREFSTGNVTTVRQNPASEGYFNGVWASRFETVQKIWDGIGWYCLGTEEANKVLAAIYAEMRKQKSA